MVNPPIVEYLTICLVYLFIVPLLSVHIVTFNGTSGILFIVSLLT